VPVDFTSEYPTCCALLGLFDMLTAESLKFEDNTHNVRKLIKRISLDRSFDPVVWEQFRFFALVAPDNDILPVRTVYDGVTHIGNNYLTSKTPLWFAGCDVIASAIRTGEAPRILRAIRIVPHGKQAGMKTVCLRGSMARRRSRCCGVSSLQVFDIVHLQWVATAPLQWEQGASLSAVQPTAIRPRQVLGWLFVSSRNRQSNPTRL